MLFRRAALPLSPRTLNLTTRTIRVHRKNTRSRWQRLDPGQQTLLALVRLHKGETFAELTAGFQISLTTAWRYVHHTTRLLAPADSHSEAEATSCTSQGCGGR